MRTFAIDNRHSPLLGYFLALSKRSFSSIARFFSWINRSWADMACSFCCVRDIAYAWTRSGKEFNHTERDASKEWTSSERLMMMTLDNSRPFALRYALSPGRKSFPPLQTITCNVIYSPDRQPVKYSDDNLLWSRPMPIARLQIPLSAVSEWNWATERRGITQWHSRTWRSICLMKMDTKDDSDRDRILQEELDAMSSGDASEENFADENDDDTDSISEQAVEQMVNDTRDQLERAMKERLAAFENEINMNFKRYEIDYDEIDELLQKPTGNNDHDIQTNVARECGIERVELDRVRRFSNHSSVVSTNESFWMFRFCKASIRKSLPQRPRMKLMRLKVKNWKLNRCRRIYLPSTLEQVIAGPPSISSLSDRLVWFSSLLKPLRGKKRTPTRNFTRNGWLSLTAECSMSWLCSKNGEK